MPFTKMITSGRPKIVQTEMDFEKISDAKEAVICQSTSPLPWIQVAEAAPYFVTDKGESWTPIGQNDAITWPDLAGFFRRKNTAAVEAYFTYLVHHGVTCLRLMLEYCQGENRYFEKPVGHFQPNMVQLWDDIFALCQKTGLRLLLTPYDTFWMWRRWTHHPYHAHNGGTCAKRSQWLLCPATRQAIKDRLAFVTARWGGSGVLFAWDLWNEIRPAHSGNSTKGLGPFIADIGGFLKAKETELYGRAHLQTVSLLNPIWQKHRHLAAVFQQPVIDFASLHLYEKGPIDSPRNTIDAAISTSRLVGEMLSHIDPAMPFLDTEHGPITTYSRRRRSLPEPFDDAYFLHMQWAHLASGGAGGGMRWPYRQPHTLTAGMRRAQAGLAAFLPLIDWNRFRRKNISAAIETEDKNITAFGCADECQAVLWLLRTQGTRRKGLVNKGTGLKAFKVLIPPLQPGVYRVTYWDTEKGSAMYHFEQEHRPSGPFCLTVPPVLTNLAIAVNGRPTPSLPVGGLRSNNLSGSS
jgi:hypothetical protein